VVADDYGRGAALLPDGHGDTAPMPVQRVVAAIAQLAAASESGIYGLSQAALRPPLRRTRRFRYVAASDARTDRSLNPRSNQMEFSAILVFTAVALWFVTEFGGESL
jgi:hypothetical protein